MVVALEHSGLTVCAFAAREGLDVERIYRWRRRLGREAVAGEPQFVEVRPASPTCRERIEVVLRSGLALRVPESFDPATLRRVLEVLEQQPPC